MASEEPDKYDLLDRLADEFAARFRRGERPPLSEYTAKYPDIAEEIRDLFPAVVAIERTDLARRDPLSTSRDRPREFGDYLIVREVGWGGMGVVYEAIQQSLGRHVALKVLPPGERAGSSRHERFRLEARAAAKLHHTNIVPVFGVGEHDGTPYYAMQFISGVGLDAIIAELRRIRGDAPEHDRPTEFSTATGSRAAAAREAAVSLATGAREVEAAPAHFHWAATEAGTDGTEAPAPPPPAPLPDSSIDVSSLVGPTAGRYWREVARVGLQVAEALAYAHEQGVLHRDIKPSNLLMDARGTAWITDFGLAKQEGSDGPTQTGDIVGTIRYMAPERFDGRSDPRSDVYALGVTLYEMLTLRPIFEGSSRAQVIERLLNAEPVAPRRVDPHVPRDLETIVLKSLAKAPSARYATAQAMAEDLRRFLADEPIRARRVRAWEHGVKWARRRPTAAAMLGLNLLIVAALVASVVWYRDRLRAGRAAALVDAIESAEIARVPQLAAELNDYRRWAAPLLTERLASHPPGSPQRIRLELAARPADPGVATGLIEAAWSARPEELAVIIDALRDDRGAALAEAGAVIERPGDPAQQIRAACVLARYAPDDSRWAELGSRLAERLMAEDLVAFGRWAELLRPAGRALLGPLEAIAREPARNEGQRLRAASLVADYSRNDPDALAGLVADADAGQFAFLMDRLAVSPGPAARVLEQILGEPQPADGAERRAQVAAALMRLGRADRAWERLRSGADPDVRVELIPRLSRLGVPFLDVAHRLAVETDPAARRALALALGEYAWPELPSPDDEAAADEPRRLFVADPDPGLHSACEWALSRWRLRPALDAAYAEARRGALVDGRRWFIDTRGVTFAIFPGPVEFDMGGPPGPSGARPFEARRRVRIPRTFAVATREAQVDGFADFLRERPEVFVDVNPKYYPDPGCPVGGMSWFIAAKFCRWKSEKEGFPEDQMCYPAIDRIGPGMALPPDLLERSGYRLPTEAEWEYAARDEAELSPSAFRRTLPSYGVFIANSDDQTWPTIKLRPNDRGLFGVRGNVKEWCGDPFLFDEPRPGTAVVDRFAPTTVAAITQFAIRGGGAVNRADDLRPWFRDAVTGMTNIWYVGFRIARTVREGEWKPARP